MPFPPAADAVVAQSQRDQVLMQSLAAQSERAASPGVDTSFLDNVLPTDEISKQGGRLISLLQEVHAKTQTKNLAERKHDNDTNLIRPSPVCER